MVLGLVCFVCFDVVRVLWGLVRTVVLVFLGGVGFDMCFWWLGLLGFVCFGLGLPLVTFFVDRLLVVLLVLGLSGWVCLFGCVRFADGFIG